MLESCFKYFFPGRLNSDCVENLFSAVRLAGKPKPTAKEFINCIKSLIIAQHLEPNSSSKYDTNEYDNQYEINFLASRSCKLTPQCTSNKPSLMTKENTISTELSEIFLEDECTEAIHHNMCGYIVRKLILRLNCDYCTYVLSSKKYFKSYHDYTALKAYKENYP